MVSGQNLTVAFLDVGQGDSILILYNGTATLVDGGKTEKGQAVLADLKKFGVRHLNFVVLTHEHEDHFGGLSGVLDEYEPDGFVYRTCAGDSCQFRVWQKVWKAQKIRARAGTRLDVDPDLDMLVLSPPGSGYADVNEDSVVLWVRYGRVCMILMGDAETRAEEYIMDSGGEEIDCDVLKVGHHGSAGSLSSVFLDVVSPDLAVISVGAGNLYEHPAPSTLALLTGIPVRRTDLDGTIVVDTDGAGLRIRTHV